MQGLILNYELTPASIHDAKAAPEVIENCPCPFIIADVGYVGKKLLANGLSAMDAIPFQYAVRQTTQQPATQKNSAPN